MELGAFSKGILRFFPLIYSTVTTLRFANRSWSYSITSGRMMFKIMLFVMELVELVKLFILLPNQTHKF